MARRGVLASLIAACTVAGGLAVAAPAQAISRKAAEQLAIRTLRPARAHGRIVLFGLPAALRRGSVVAQYNPFGGTQAPQAPHARGSTARAPAAAPGTMAPIKLRHAAFIFWEDLAHGAAFEHASYLLLVDQASGHVIARKGLAWWPRVNGKDAAFVDSDSKGRILFRNIPGVHKARAAGAPPLAHAAAARLGGANDCLFLIGDRTLTDHSAELFGHSLAAFGALATSNGLMTTQASTSLDLHMKLLDAVDKKGCKDVMIFLAGHGSPAQATPFPGNPSVMVQPTAQPTVALGSFPDTPGGPAVSHPITAQGLINQMSWFPPEVKFKIVIFSCFSGRFETALQNDPHIKDGGLIATSSSATEYSWGRVTEGDPGANGFNTSGHELTNPTTDPRALPGYVFGLTQSIQQILDNPMTYAADRGSLAKILFDAHNHANAGDFSAQLGWTHPQAFFMPPPPPPVQVGFAAPVAYPTGANPHEVLVADINGDGKPDIITGNGNGSNGSVSVLLGHGDGTFQAPITFPLAGTPISLGVADVTGDGRLDILAGLGGTPTVELLPQNSSGTFGFGSPLMINTGGSDPFSIAVPVINGKTVLVVGMFGELRTAVDSGAPPYFNTFNQIPVGGNPLFSIAQGDFNGDGIPDIAGTLFNSNQVQLFTGNGNGTFSAGPTFRTAHFDPLWLTVDNLHPGSFPDIVTVDGNGGSPPFGASVFLGNGPISFASPFSISLSAQPVQIVSAPLGGLTPKSLFIDTTAGVSVFRGDGNGNFTPFVGQPTLPVPSPRIAVSPLRGSGAFTDLVGVDPATSTVEVDLGK
jgi:hypothetical protein